MRLPPLLLVLLPVPLPAQDITVQNLAPFARREWAAAVVPFARGAVQDTPALRAGAATVWQPFGARWPDGSLRQALCLFPVEMKAMSEQRVTLRAGAPAPPDGKVVDPVRGGAVRVAVVVRADGRTTRAAPAFVRALEDNAARRVSLFRCRVPGTGLVFELLVTAWAGQAHCAVDFGLFFSDPRSKALEQRVDAVTVETRGMHAVVRHARALGVDIAQVADGTDLRLLGKTVLGDGQGIRRAGVLAPMPGDDPPLQRQTVQAAALYPVLAATSWRASGAYGPFGVVPAPPPWMRGPAGRAAFARRHDAFLRDDRGGDPFAVFPFGLAKNPGRTGSQGDFGVLKLAPVASAALPSFLLEVERATLQEACRPVHWFEADGAPVQIADHPQLVVWSGRPHWNCEVSPDRLGKPCPEPRHETHGWQGKDRQHWSSNYLCGYYLLTGAAWARREIENEVQLYLGAQTVREGLATTGPGAARAVGRMLMLGCWLHQCTGDARLLERMHARMKVSYLPHWAGRDFAADKVRPMQVNGPDGRILKGRYSYWSPWQESLAAVGLFALWRTGGSDDARRLAAALAHTVLHHGWTLDGGRARVGYGMRWKDGGVPLTDAERRDGSMCAWAGGGITTWSMGALEVARFFAMESEDAASAQRADALLQALRTGRDRPPRGGWWDEYREWDAVR